MDFPVKEEEKWDYANVQQLNEIDHMVHKKSPEWRFTVSQKNLYCKLRGIVLQQPPLFSFI